MGIHIKASILCLTITATVVIICLSAFSRPIAAEDISSFSESAKKYILGEFEGNLAIYETSDKVPIEVLDVKLDSLPERDIERIKKGIYADTLNEIISLAEDYE